MAIMSIFSDSPTFSHELGKNPATGMQHRAVREGIGYGWFNDDQDLYNLFFHEGQNTQSFAKHDFNYLTQLDRSAPFAYNTLITQFFKETLNKPYEHREKGNWSVTLEQVYYRGQSTMRHLTEQFPRFNIEVEELDGDCLYKVIISAEDIDATDILQFVCIITMFLSTADQRKMKINEDFVERYVRYFDKFKVPYFIRYMFCRNFFVDRLLFERYGYHLQKPEYFDDGTKGIVLHYGDTGQQRADWIVQNLPCLDDVIDIGCGEGKPAEQLIKQGKLISNYRAVDIDEDELAKFNTRFRKARTDTVFHTYDSWTKAVIDSDGYVELLMTEVVEHMPKSDAIELVQEVLWNAKWTTAVITVPNKKFNKHYLFEDGQFRHHDHDWEPDMEEFMEFIASCTEELAGKVEVSFHGIGDTVDGESTSIGCVLKRTDLPKRAIMYVGAPGCGKSTMAAKYEGHFDWMEMNRDNIRFGYNQPRDWTEYEFTPQNENKVTAAFNNRLKKAFRHGRNLVFSDTNINLFFREKYLAMIKEQGYEVEMKYFDVPLPTLLERNENRSGGIPVEKVIEYWQRLQLELRPELQNMIDHMKTAQKNLWTPVYCVDLDGTFFDISHRKGYEEEKCGDDESNYHIVNIVKSLMQAGFHIAFTSGRRDIVRDKTFEMLAEELGKPGEAGSWELMMRASDDNKRDALLKIEMVSELISRNLPHIPIAAIDDRKQVVEECWSLLGIPCLNVGLPTERY